MNQPNGLEAVRAVFKNDRFAADAGCEIEDYRDGFARIGMTVRPAHLNAAGAVQGGAIFTLADFAFAVASNGGGEWTVSLSNSISFLHGVREGSLTAEARRVSQTRRTCCYDVTVTDQTGETVAKMTVTGYRMQKPI